MLPYWSKTCIELSIGFFSDEVAIENTGVPYAPYASLPMEAQTIAMERKSRLPGTVNRGY
jgi:hypothetical protein